MEGRVGKSVITLFLCLVLLSALLFIFFENNRSEPLAQATDFSSSAPPETVLVEKANPWTFTDVMIDYDFDLYRETSSGGYDYVPPPSFGYTDPAALDALTLGHLGVADDEINPASRETTISLTLLRVPPATPVAPTPTEIPVTPGTPTPTPRPTITPYPMSLGQSTALSFYLTPATKTVILDNGAATATVQIMPDVIDAYVAVRTPMGNLVFVNSFSHMQGNYTANPVPIVKNSQINKLSGTIFSFKMTSLNVPGHYKIYAVMVPPGANVFDSRNWISNLATIMMSYGIVEE